MGNCEYVRDYYGVPACIGRRVVINGKHGVIAEDRGHYIGVTFDSDKPGVVCNAHPTSNVEYGGMGLVREMTRAQRNYREFLSADWFHGSFSDWLRQCSCRTV